jgi:hypothetical protein
MGLLRRFTLSNKRVVKAARAALGAVCTSAEGRAACLFRDAVPQQLVALARGPPVATEDPELVCFVCDALVSMAKEGESWRRRHFGEVFVAANVPQLLVDLARAPTTRASAEAVEAVVEAFRKVPYHIIVTAGGLAALGALAGTEAVSESERAANGLVAIFSRCVRCSVYSAADTVSLSNLLGLARLPSVCANAASIRLFAETLANFFIEVATRSAINNRHHVDTPAMLLEATRRYEEVRAISLSEGILDMLVALAQQPSVDAEGARWLAYLIEDFAGGHAEALCAAGAAKALRALQERPDVAADNSAAESIASALFALDIC